MLNSDQTTYIKILEESGAVKVGDFVTKSGRRTPYFFNTGAICRGDHVNAMAQIYARFFMEHFGGKIRHIFGPAYKGIPLVSSLAAALSEHYGHEVFLTYNRKEIKKHGEGGSLIGFDFNSIKTPARVVIVEDVLTAGTSIRESIDLLSEFPVKIAGVLVGIDREEIGKNEQKSAHEEISDLIGGAPVISIVKLSQIRKALPEVLT